MAGEPYSTRALLSAMAIWRDPETHIATATENFEISGIDLLLRTELKILVGADADFEIASSTADEDELLLLPVAQLRKGQHRDFYELVGDRPCRFLSHPEHVAAVRLMLYQRLYWTYMEWIAEAGQAALAALEDIEKKVYQIAESPEDEARAIAATLFDKENELTVYKNGVRPSGEKRFVRLVRALVKNSPLIIETTGRLDRPISVSYATRLNLADFREGKDRLKTPANGVPANLVVPAYFARKCGSYVATFTAPEGHYVYELGAFAGSFRQLRDKGPEPLEALPRSDLEGIHRNGPCQALSHHAATRASIYVSNGSMSDDSQISLGVTLYEIPAGTTGRQLAFTSASCVLVGIVLLLNAVDGVSTATPGLMASVLGLGAVASAISQHMGGDGAFYARPLLTRMVGAVTTIATTLLAFWIVFSSTERPKSGSFIGRGIFRFLWDWGWIGCLVFPLLGAIALSIRLFISFKKFADRRLDKGLNSK